MNGLCVFLGGMSGKNRLGYGVPGEWFIWAGTTAVVAWPWLIPEKPKPKPARKAEISYSGDIFCGHCYNFISVASMGYSYIPQIEVTCSGCGTKYLAYRP